MGTTHLDIDNNWTQCHPISIRFIKSGLFEHFAKFPLFDMTYYYIIVTSCCDMSSYGNNMNSFMWLPLENKCAPIACVQNVLDQSRGVAMLVHIPRICPECDIREYGSKEFWVATTWNPHQSWIEGLQDFFKLLATSTRNRHWGRIWKRGTWVKFCVCKRLAPNILEH
jgi:hypothetical protein